MLVIRLWVRSMIVEECPAKSLENRMKRLAVFTLILFCAFAGAQQPAEKEKPTEKPLTLENLLARELAQQLELNAAIRAGNEIITTQLTKDLQKERDGWVGKQVKGVATITVVNTDGIGAWAQDNKKLPSGKVTKSIRMLDLRPKDKTDPLLKTFKKDSVITFTGVLDKGHLLGDPFTIKECTFK